MRFLMDDFDRAFNGIWNQRHFGDARAIAPSCETSETETAYFLSFDIPGMKKEDIKIELKDHRLTVSGERKREVHDRRQSLDHQEKTYGYFERSFGLPESALDDKIEARFENGVLEIAIPKKEDTQPRRIDIQNAGSGIFGKFLEAKTKKE